MDDEGPVSLSIICQSIFKILLQEDLHFLVLNRYDTEMT